MHIAARMHTNLEAQAATTCKITKSELSAFIAAAATHMLYLARISSSRTIDAQTPAVGMRFSDGLGGSDTLVFVQHAATIWAVFRNSRMRITAVFMQPPTPPASSYPPPYVLELRAAALRTALGRTPTRTCTSARHAPTPVRFGGDAPLYLPAVPDYSKTPLEQLLATYSTPRTPATLTHADYEHILTAARAANTWAPSTPKNLRRALELQGHAAPDPILAAWPLEGSSYTWVRVETRPGPKQGTECATHLALVVRLPELCLNPIVFPAGVPTNASSMAEPYTAAELAALRACKAT